MSTRRTTTVVELYAGPPAANPPLFLVFIIVGVSLIAPVLFRLASPPNIFFAIATLALGLAGIVSVFGALAAQRRRRLDSAIRRRATISMTGVTFYRQPGEAGAEFFARGLIKRVWATKSALIVDIKPDHARPGRHRLSFSQLTLTRDDLEVAISEFNQSIDSFGRSLGP